MLRLPAVMLNSSPPASLPGVSLTNGPIVRATSRCRARLDPDHRGAEVGHHPRRGRAGHRPRQVEHLETLERRGARAWPLAAGTSGRQLLASRRTSSVCSPSRGARPRRTCGTALERHHGPGACDRDARRAPRRRRRRSSRGPRTAGCAARRAGVATGAISRILSHAASSSSALVLRRAELADDVLQPLVLLDRLATVVEHVGVVEPVLVPRRLVAAALLVDPRPSAAR